VVLISTRGTRPMRTLETEGSVECCGASSCSVCYRRWRSWHTTPCTLMTGYDVLSLAGFIEFAIGGGVPVGGMRSRASQERACPALVAAYIGAVFAALCIATLDTPDLPIVEPNSPRGDTTFNCSELSKDRTFVKVSRSSNVTSFYNKSGLVAYYIADIQPVRYFWSYALLRNPRT
jgi:hypothetical protein